MTVRGKRWLRVREASAGMSERRKRWYPCHQYAHVRRTDRGDRGGGKEKVEASKVEAEERRRS
jgi:hypothetical protein